jgi:Tfp pilus assembly protein FimV
LTRRGRAVLGSAAAVLAAAVAALAIMAASSGAQASDHGSARGGYAGMREIVVRPGQTLWSIASAAEPTADPRLVVEQIMTVNSMTSTQIEAGQLLWVPR